MDYASILQFVEMNPRFLSNLWDRLSFMVYQHVFIMVDCIQAPETTIKTCDYACHHRTIKPSQKSNCLASSVLNLVAGIDGEISGSGFIGYDCRSTGSGKMQKHSRSM